MKMKVIDIELTVDTTGRLNPFMIQERIAAAAQRLVDEQARRLYLGEAPLLQSEVIRGLFVMGVEDVVIV